MTYEQYIASTEWRAKRQERLEIDGHRCVVCKHDGSEYRLEVHHLHYKTFGNENALFDLVTACARCHPYLDDSRKDKKYTARTHEPTYIASISVRTENDHGMANTEVQVDIILPNDSAQRTDGRSAKQVVEIDKDDFVKARQNRR